MFPRNFKKHILERKEKDFDFKKFEFFLRKLNKFLKKKLLRLELNKNQEKVL